MRWYIALLFLSLMFSCKKRKCDISDPSSLKWQPFGNNAGYFACKTGEGKLALHDSVTITNMGYFKKNGRLVPVTDSSSSLFFPDITLGRLTYDDARTNKEIGDLLGIMGRNAEYYLQISLLPLPKNKPVINIYLNSTADSAKAIQWALQLPFARSVKYTSKEAAKREMLGDNSNVDFDMINEMDNPLPNTITLTINPDLMNTRQLDSIKQLLLKNEMVNTVNCPNPDFDKIAAEFAELVNTSFLFRIKT